MERSQRKRCAPSWLKEKPYLKIRFSQDGVTTRVNESWKIKLTESSKELNGSLANFSFSLGQVVWCYWKTIDEKEKLYFEGKIIEMWNHSEIVEEESETNELHVVDDTDVEASPIKKKRVMKDVKKTAKRRLEKSTNSIDKEAMEAKRLANKEKRDEEKAKQEDNLAQTRELLNISDENMEMLFDFMQQITSRLDSLEKKVDGNQQVLERLIKKIEKRKDHSLPVQVFVKSGDNSERDRPASPCLSQTSFASTTCSSPPVLCSTPKSSPASMPHAEDDDCQKKQDDQGALTCTEAADNSIIMDTAESPQQENDMAIIGDYKFGVKTDKECFDNIVQHSHSARALALNLLDNLIPKEVQRISNIKGTNGKSPLNPSILAAIKGQIKRQYKWTDEELEKNWTGKTGIQQKIADKCRNLNKASCSKKNEN